VVSSYRARISDGSAHSCDSASSIRSRHAQWSRGRLHSGLTFKLAPSYRPHRLHRGLRLPLRPGHREHQRLQRGLISPERWGGAVHSQEAATSRQALAPRALVAGSHGERCTAGSGRMHAGGVDTRAYVAPSTSCHDCTSIGRACSRGQGRRSCGLTNKEHILLSSYIELSPADVGSSTARTSASLDKASDTAAQARANPRANRPGPIA
jgi:hypothetical protein